MSYFYYPSGEIINKDIFLDFYSKSYYLTANHEVETLITQLIGKETYSETDVFRIIAWKTGNILSFKSKENAIKYKEGWIEETLSGYIYGYILNIKELTKMINETPAKPEEFLSKIAPCKVLSKKGVSKALGNVYAITFLYFKSNGSCPFYDSFAQKAITAIANKKAPPYKIENPSYDFSSFKSIYYAFCSEVKAVFPDYSSHHRRIDQALWVYGHMFQNGL